MGLLKNICSLLINVQLRDPIWDASHIRVSVTWPVLFVFVFFAAQNKERERTREREKAAREREARYNNGHLFTSLSVSGTTLCSACNKSITAKEALCCPTCNVTIHNRCRDALPNCAKVKQRNVTLRTRNPVTRERPTSAIYPSESLRHSLLGSRRGRSGLALSKSVSTNNIGNLNEDSPLGLRRILSQSTDSLSFRNRTISTESLNDDGDYYYYYPASVLEELELEGEDFKADSWSTAVDAAYLHGHGKNIIKRQDVIYELIQTEVHHVRTLRIMERVFRRGLLEELQPEPGTLHALFPCLDQLVAIHSHFLAQLLGRRHAGLQPGSQRNFTVRRLGDILLEQFSGQSADDMRKTYAEFCSGHTKAVKLYKSLLARDKRFQSFIRRVTRGPWLRCHGFQECVLLVTQRISKYPVLIQRILHNTVDEEEASSIGQALSRVRDLLNSIDQQMEDLEKTQRMQEIHAKLDQRAESRVRDGGLFRPAELLRRKLLHEGTLLWKTPGSRLKDVKVLLMTDILVFLQEKDQRYIFPCLDKPPVLSLQNLIVRDIANQERGMFLIDDCSPPQMYEVHAASREDKNAWIRQIQHAVSRCPSRQEFPLIETEREAHLRRLKADLQQKDREMLELLQERVTLFCELAQTSARQDEPEPPPARYFFRADTPQAPRAEKFLLDATVEVDRLSEVLLGSGVDTPHLCHRNHVDTTDSGEQGFLLNGAHELPGAKEVCQRLMNLSVYLHALQAAVIKQDSILEVLLQNEDAAPRSPTATGSRRGQDRQAGELALLQRQHSLLQEELLRLRDAETRLKDSEKARAKLEKRLRHLKVCGQGVASGDQGRGVPEPIQLHQSNTPQGGSDEEEVDMTSDEDGEEEEEEEEMEEENASRSSRDFQDIPEEM
ncbi:rho guanine nucleotide exchange factor 2 isoform X2 [Stigmatopora argus]